MILLLVDDWQLMQYPQICENYCVRASPTTIWQVPVYLPYLQPKLTPALIAAAKQRIGHTLPAAYLALLKKQNGGYMRFALPQLGSLHRCIAGIGPHFPSLSEHAWGDGQDLVSFSLAHLFPFDGDGHWNLCLDYRDARAEPAITLVDTEADACTHVAASFAAYLKMLELAVDDGACFLAGVTDIEALKASFAAQLNVQFDAPDDWAHGYPVQRAQIGSDGWLWLSPNDVPLGFVRSTDDRYEDLKNLLPGTGKRYPTLPDNSYLLSTTDAERAAVLGACARLGLNPDDLAAFLRRG
jgi:hypothetical protein